MAEEWKQPRDERHGDSADVSSIWLLVGYESFLRKESNVLLP